MPRPRSLTHTAIAAAALAVIDRDGLAALSMRTVAAELGVGTMSLYRYVDDRAQLERLVVDLALSAVDPALPPRLTWRGRITTLMVRIRDAVTAHPQVVPLFLTHRHTNASVMRCGETILHALTDAGFTGKRRVIAFRALLAYLVGALQVEHLGPLSGPGTAALAQLPHADYPFLAATARQAQRVSVDEEFRDGLAAVLRGLTPPRAGDTRAGPGVRPPGG